MNKFTTLIFVLLFQFSIAQKLENLKQNINSNGSFLISTYSDRYYNDVIKNSLPLLDPIKNKDKTNFEQLKKIFPDFIEENCLKIDEETFRPKKFKICEANTKEKYDSTSIAIDGKLFLESKLDEFYIFRYYFMEQGGYYLLNSKTQKIYQIFHQPKFSPDKTFIVAPYVDYHNVSIEIIDISTDRNLKYYLGEGRFTLNKIELAKIDSYRKKILFLDLTQVVDYNEDYQKIEEKSRNIKLLIQ